MKLTLKIWRQKNTNQEGLLHDYILDNVSPDMSFLEMLDMLNNMLIKLESSIKDINISMTKMESEIRSLNKKIDTLPNNKK